MKILHIIKSLGRGGAEMLLPETINLHDKSQFEFHVIYFLPWKDQLVKQIEQHGAKVICIPAENNLKILLSARKIVKYVRENNINIIHAHLPWAGITGRLAGKISGVPVIYTEHNMWERYHKLTFTLNKLTFSMQQVVVPVSKDVERSIQTHFSNNRLKIKTILNGVNTGKFNRDTSDNDKIKNELKIAPGSVVIGTVSVFRSQKRLTKWLEIAYNIHKKNPDTYFIIIGDGPLRDEIHIRANELEMHNYLHFAGLQEDVIPYYKSMDIFMMASEFEGLPIALLEAMSMECIPCCTRAGGIQEVIEHEKDGFLVETDMPMLLIDVVSDLLQNWERRAGSLKQAARKKVEKDFSLQRMVNELEHIYISLNS